MKILEIGFKDGPTLEAGYLKLESAGHSFSRLEFATVSDFLDAPNLLGSCDLLALFPQCSVFSMMSVRHHWEKQEDKLIPKSEKAQEALLMLRKMDLLANQSPLWFIENPAGTMHKQWTRGNFHRITHCQYNGGRMKPTNIWTSWDWISRPPCHYGDPCHPATPWGSRKGGTQAMKTKKDRAQLPLALAIELIESANQHSLSFIKREEDAISAKSAKDTQRFR